MDLTIDNFINITENGISVMDYADIAKTLLIRYRQIYGSDIDLDPRSADGRFIYDVATIINNVCQISAQLYGNMNPANATGIYLDILSSLTNVHRESQTYSQAKVKITNPTSNDISITSYSNLAMYDDSGSEWNPSYESDISLPLVIKANSYEEVNYTATDYDIKATSSLNFMTNNTEATSLTTKISTFEKGSDEEDDNSLRYRRSSDSTYGYSILEGLQGKLRNLFGINDCYIQSYAGNSDESSICYVDNKTTTMPIHSVSVLLRYNKVNNPKKTSIAKTIKDNLTAGISTNGTTSQYNLSNTKVVTETRWYITTKQSPTITITLSNLYNFATNTTANKIGEALTDYLNNLTISRVYTLTDLIQVIQYADPKYMSRSTYQVSDVKGLFDTSGNCLNRGCYFDYGSRQDIDYKVTSNVKDDVATITIEVL